MTMKANFATQMKDDFPIFLREYKKILNISKKSSAKTRTDKKLIAFAT